MVFLTGVNKSGLGGRVLSPETYFDCLSQFTSLFGLDCESVEEKEYLVLAGWVNVG